MRYYVIETPMDNLITDALMWKFNTDFVVSNGFRFCPPLVPPAGGEADITNEYLWSMLPVESAIKAGTVSGRQILDWLESELENAFAQDASKRFGGWFVRFKGLFVKFTIGNPTGERVREVTVEGKPLVPDRVHGAGMRTRRRSRRHRLPHRPRRQSAASRHERASGRDGISRRTLSGVTAVEGRAVATDAPADLLSQVDGTSYRFR